MEALRVGFALVALIGMIGLVKPIARLKMEHRWHAFGWLAAGFIGTAALPPKAPSTAAVVAATPDMSDQAVVNRIVEQCKRVNDGGTIRNEEQFLRDQNAFMEIDGHPKPGNFEAAGTFILTGLMAKQAELTGDLSPKEALRVFTEATRKCAETAI